MKIKAGVKKSVNYIAGRKEVFKGLKVDTRVQIRVERGGGKGKGYRVGKMYYKSRLKGKAVV